MDLYILSFILVWRVVDFELRDKYKKSNNKNIWMWVDGSSVHLDYQNKLGKV